MDFECNSIIKTILPAIRINMAEELKSKYNLNQQEIADRLGIAQVAVSKYLSGRYSASVKRMRDYIKRIGLVDEIAKEAAKSHDTDAIGAKVNHLCARIASDKSVNV